METHLYWYIRFKLNFNILCKFGPLLMFCSNMAFTLNSKNTDAGNFLFDHFYCCVVNFTKWKCGRKCKNIKWCHHYGDTFNEDLTFSSLTPFHRCVVHWPGKAWGCRETQRAWDFNRRHFFALQHFTVLHIPEQISSKQVDLENILAEWKLHFLWF